MFAQSHLRHAGVCDARQIYERLFFFLLLLSLASLCVLLKFQDGYRKSDDGGVRRGEPSATRHLHRHLRSFNSASLYAGPHRRLSRTSCKCKRKTINRPGFLPFVFFARVQPTVPPAVQKNLSTLFSGCDFYWVIFSKRDISRYISLSVAGERFKNWQIIIVT